ncbi:VQ motif-containing protein 22-like [Impatiens glandulifera]|uniref:VQ motif-containing protein 22-like n=1 Tax=Impatiens glandulifera TaxID=253017 RepID=UPI001FB1328F|nr:VQ motif-containing protein 22-like [Impatiens glandulifera]
MSSEIMRNSHEWFQQQQQQHRYFNGGGGQTVYPSSPTSTLSHDGITVVTTEGGSTAPLISTSDKSKGLGKTIRRRSRASKKTPVTLLNADVKDFRALVQRFTGCSSSEISFANRKGPVNLNFAASQDHHRFFLPTANSAPSQNGFNSNNNNNYHHHQQQQQQQQAAWRPEAEDGHYFKNGGILMRSNGVQEEELGVNYNTNNNNMQTVDQFQSLDDILEMDDINGTSLHDLIGDIIA